ncbi:MAG: FecR domain-containing protein [Niastella sp.]|nr:FecR domain-containing protein [Niastella sp.]
MKDQEKYNGYSVQDFICDESFQDWVLRPATPNGDAWRAWIQHNPGKQAAIDEATLLLSSLRFRVDRLSAGSAEEALRKALQQIDEQEQQATTPAPAPPRFLRPWRVAAIWIALLGAAMLVVLWYRHSSRPPQPTLVTTGFGQLDSVMLPDKSVVVLNANSTIQYDQNWSRETPREVWLKGEALFRVQHVDQDNHIEPRERFLVHVGKTTVQVLGTTFNIRQRRQKIEIALLSGIIDIHFDDASKPGIRLQPGDMVVVDTTGAFLERQHKNTKELAAWTQKRLVLNNPTLREIADYLEDIYGKKIVLSDPSLASRKVEGPILLDSLDDALFVLSTVLNVTIDKEKETIIIRPR